ncbi:nucleotidyltransferase domain-containing protein [Archangium lipolyticum]|uniref:nucleotidyltransferase domain-containing protein n=1 Tax=Archangium lipolyticum TaxID=2970465 RepID=UPI00214A859D|nr:nucleotidyltransferase domain-containing protein [Archangium lipolyticum]
MQHLPLRHREFLTSALGAWRANPGILGVLAGGSFLSRSMDEFSDLDLILVVSDELRATIAQERTTIARAAGPLLQGFTGEHVGEPRLLICLYGPPLLHVDLKFISVSELDSRIEEPEILFERAGVITERLRSTRANPLETPSAQWIEDRFWVWIHYGLDKLRRGELFECLDMLAFLRAQALAPLIQRIDGGLWRGVRRLEASRHASALSRVCARHDAQECLRAMAAAVEVYTALRSQLHESLGPRHSPAEPVVRAYLAEVCAASQGGH